MCELHHQCCDLDDPPVESPENGHLLGHRRGLSHGVLLDGNECWLGPCHVPLAGGETPSSG